MIHTFSVRILQLVLLSCVIALALSINYLSAWTGPTALPPGNNTAAPLNTLGTAQVKNGNLSVGLSTNTTANLGFTVYGSQYTNGTVSASGNAGGVAGNGVVGTAGSAGYHGVIGTSGGGSGSYGVEGVGQGGTYYGLLGRSDGYSFVGNGEVYNQGIVRSTTGGFAFPDGTVQTTSGTVAGKTFGGMYYTVYTTTCVNGNPLNSNLCSCAPGYTTVVFANVNGEGGREVNWCYK